MNRHGRGRPVGVHAYEPACGNVRANREVGQQADAGTFRDCRTARVDGVGKQTGDEFDLV
jgi:hypothetical protein